MDYGKPTAMELHERLTVARKRAGFETAAEAAAALGVPYPTYAGHENGSSGFRADKGELYARRFKVNFEWLMRGKGPAPGDEDANAKTVSSAEDIRELLQKIDGLKPENITVLLAMIEGFRRANSVSPPQAPPGAQSEPGTSRRQSSPFA